MIRNPEYCPKKRVRNRERAAQWRNSHRGEIRLYDLLRRQASKHEVLSYYGKNGDLCCRWPNCEIRDIDMLTLDHVNNDGKADRKAKGMGNRGGHKFYTYLKIHGYPEGYQTLCWNHQWKKELTYRRRWHVQTNS